VNAKVTASWSSPGTPPAGTRSFEQPCFSQPQPATSAALTSATFANHQFSNLASVGNSKRSFCQCSCIAALFMLLLLPLSTIKQVLSSRDALELHEFLEVVSTPICFILLYEHLRPHINPQCEQRLDHKATCSSSAAAKLGAGLHQTVHSS
jgi:hypothetical protein